MARVIRSLLLLLGLWSVSTGASAAPVAAVIGLLASALASVSVATWVMVGLSVASQLYAKNQQKKAARRAAARKAAEDAANLKDRTTTIVASDSPWPTIYGSPAPVGGSVAAVLTSGGTDEYKHIIVVFAAHECEAIDQIYIDGTSVGALDAEGWASGAEFQIPGPPQYKPGPGPHDPWVLDVSSTQPMVNVQLHTSPGGVDAADGFLLARLGASGRWTEAHKLSGFTYAVVTINLLLERFQGGLPQITAKIRGKKVFDPRTGHTAYSRNPALCLADFLRSEVGYLAAPEQIDENALIAAANACDEEIYGVESLQDALNYGGSRARYVCDGTFKSDQDRENTRQQLEDAMAGFSLESSGVWRIQAGAWSTPVLALTDEDMLAPTAVAQTCHPGTARYNGMRGTYVNAAGNGVSEDFAPYQNALFRELDGKDKFLDLSLAFTAAHVRCHQIARTKVEDSRGGFVLAIHPKMSAWHLQPGDRIVLTSALYGFANKTFRVQDWTYSRNAPLSLLVIEDVPAYWDTADEVLADAAPNTNLPSPFLQPGPPLDLTVDSGVEQAVLQGTTLVVRARVSWRQSDASAVLRGGAVRVQWQLDGDDPSVWQTDDLPGDATQTWLLGLAVGSRYTVRVRFMTAYAVSPWAWAVHDMTGKDTPPEEVHGLTLTVTDTGIVARWAAPRGLDVVDYAGTQLRRGASWEAAKDDVRFDGDARGANIGWFPAGAQLAWAAHHNSAERWSQPVSAAIAILAPATPVLKFELSYEFVRLTWADCRATQPISHYAVRQGQNWADAAPLGQTTATRFDLTAQGLGARRYWVVAVDVAGNAGAPAMIDVTVDQILQQGMQSLGEQVGDAVEVLGERIDTSESNWAVKLAAEAQARGEGIAAEAQTRAQALTDEAQARLQGDASEAQARGLALATEAQVRAQAVATEAQTRSQALATEAQARAQDIAAEAAARTAALNAKAAELRAGIDALNAQMADIVGTEAYSSTTAYAVGAMVEREGKLYRNIKACVGTPPPNAAYWELVGDYASLGAAVAAMTAQLKDHESRITQTATGLTAEISDRNALAVQLRGGYSGTDPNALTTGLLYSERQARVSGDSVNASAIDGVAGRMTAAEGKQALDASAIAGLQSGVSAVNGQLASQSNQLTSLTNGIGAAGQNLMPNGSFELPEAVTSFPSGWEVYNNGVGAPTWSRPPGRLAGLAVAVKFTVAAGFEHGVYGVGLVGGWRAGQSYVISFYARKVGGAGFAGMDLRWNTWPATTQALLNPALSTAFQRYAFQITWGAAVEGAGRLFLTRAGASAAGDELVVDDVMVTEGTVLTGYAPREDAESIKSAAATSAALASLTSTVTQQGNTLTSQSGQLTSLTNRIGAAEGVNAAQAASISGLDSRVTQAEGSITSQSGQLISLSNRVTTVEGKQSADASAIAGLQSSVSSINGTLTTQSGQLTSLTNRIGAAEGVNASQATALSGLDSRVTQAEGSITSQSGQLTSLSNRVTTVEGKQAGDASAIAGLQSSVSSINGTLTSQGSSITALTAGIGEAGQNLAPNGSFELPADTAALPAGWSAYDNSGLGGATWNRPPGRVTGLAMAVKFKSAVGVGPSHGVWGDQRVAGGWKAGQSYVVSWYAKKIGGAAFTGMSMVWNQAPASVTALLNPALGTEFQRYACLVTWGSAVEANGRLFITRVGTSAAGDEVIVDDVMVTEGRVLTGYAPREDAESIKSATATSAALSSLDSRVTQAEGSITSQSGQLTSLSNRVTTVEGKQSADASAIAGLQSSVSSINGTLTTQSGQLTSLTNRIGAAEGVNASQATALSGLDSRVTQAEGTITSQSGQLMSLSNRVTTVEGKQSADASAIAGLQSSVSAVNGQLTSQSNQLTSLTNGIGTAGQNLAPNGSFELPADTAALPAGWYAYDNSGLGGATWNRPPGRVTGLAMAVKFKSAVGVGPSHGVWGDQRVAGGWKAGQSYVVSWYAKKIGGAAFTGMSMVWNQAPASVTALLNPALGTEFQRYACLVTWGSAVEANGRLFITRVGTSAAGDEVIVDDVMVTEGTVLTGYAPREDAESIKSAAATSAALSSLDSRVTQAEGSITSQSGQLTSLSNRVTTVEGKQSADASAIAGLQSSVSSINGTLTTQSGQLTSLTNGIGAAGQNLMPNGSFELPEAVTSFPSGWGVYNNGTGAPTWNRPSGRLAGLAVAVKFTVAAGFEHGVYGAGLVGGWQPGQSYVISFYARKVGGAGFAGMDLRWNTWPATTQALLNPILSTSFQRYAFQITWGAAVEAAGRLFLTRLGASAAGDELVIDDVMVTEGSVLTGYAPREDAESIKSAAATSAALSSLTSTVTQQGDALASQSGQITSLSNRIGAAEGVNVTQASAISGLQSTVTQQGSTLTSQANQMTLLQASVSTDKSAIATLQQDLSVTASNANKALARYTLKLDVAGNVSGMLFDNNGSTSRTVFTSDVFAVARPGSTDAKYPFVIGMVGGTSTVGINGNLLVDGSITARSISVNSLSAITANLGYIYSAALDIAGNGADWGYLRSVGKWWGDGKPGWIMARSPTDGGTFFDVQAGGNRIWMSSWNDCGIEFPGIRMTNGGLTISQINVIDTLNVRGRALGTMLWARGAGEIWYGYPCWASVTFTVPAGQYWESANVAVFAPSYPVASPANYSYGLTGAADKTQYVAGLSDFLPGLTLASITSHGPGTHTVRAFLSGYKATFNGEVVLICTINKYAG